MPDWVEQGYQVYAKRLGNDCRLELIEIPLGRRSKSASQAASHNKARADEGIRMLERCKPDDRIIALDVGGRQFSTEALATRLESWRQDGRDVAMLIGGPDGLADACLKKAEMHWSLSTLTMPHGLVRVLLAEQLYRAWSILQNHPYHRA